MLGVTVVAYFNTRRFVTFAREGRPSDKPIYHAVESSLLLARLLLAHHPPRQAGYTVYTTVLLYSIAPVAREQLVDLYRRG